MQNDTCKYARCNKAERKKGKKDKASFMGKAKLTKNANIRHNQS